MLPTKELKRNELELLEWRSGVKSSDCIYDASAEVCAHHCKGYLERFEKRQTKCCNIFQKHLGIKLPKARHSITLSMAKLLVKSYQTVIPGLKLCVSCYRQAQTETVLTTTDDTYDQTSCSSKTDQSEFAFGDNNDALIRVSSTLLEQYISPLKLHAQPPQQKKKQAKEKLTKAAKNLQASFTAAGIDVSPVKTFDSSLQSNNRKNADFDILMNELKCKFQSSTYKEQIQILTLKPNSWTTDETKMFLIQPSIASKKQ